MHSLPFLSALKKKYPDAEVHWAVFKGLEGILQGHPLLHRLIVIDKQRLRHPLTLPGEALALRRQLKQEGYDIAIDLQGLLRSGIIARLSAASIRVGFVEAREGAPKFYTHKVEGGTDIHAVDRYLRIATELGCDTSSADFPMVFDEPPLEFREQFKNQSSDDKFAVLIPGARWKTKLWPAESFGRLAAMLPLRSVVVGGPEDAALGETIVSMSGGKAISMAGKTSLRQLSGIIKDAAYAVTNDTGPMHIAAAFKVPVFAIFGPTNHIRTGPYGNNHTIINSTLPCAPCYRRHCDDLKCMHSITPETVLEAVASRGY